MADDAVNGLDGVRQPVRPRYRADLPTPKRRRSGRPGRLRLTDERVSDLREERVDGEWLLDEVQILVEAASIADDISGVSGHEQVRGIDPELCPATSCALPPGLIYHGILRLDLPPLRRPGPRLRSRINESDMTESVRTEPASGADPGAPAPTLLLNLLAAHDSCVVHVTGEVDLATRDQLVSASTSGDHRQMVIDLGGVTFMDCGGLRAFSISRQIIESQGRSLAITGETGQPARFFDLIAELERDHRDQI